MQNMLINLFFISFYALLVGIAMRVFEVGMRQNGIFYAYKLFVNRKVQNPTLHKFLTCSRCLSIWIAAALFWLTDTPHTLFHFITFALLSFGFTDRFAGKLTEEFEL
jgi:hypothetical protein